MPLVLKCTTKSHFEIIMSLGYVTHLALLSDSSFPEVNVHLVPVVSFLNTFNISGGSFSTINIYLLKLIVFYKQAFKNILSQK